MHPVLFKIGSFTINSYGVMIGIAFSVAIVMTYYGLKRKGVDPSHTYDMALAAIIGGMLGARIFYVIGHWDYFKTNPLEMIDFRAGGLVFYGGLLLGILLVYLVIRWRKIPLGKTADAVAPTLPLAIAITRIGCFLNGCCYGLPTSTKIGIKFPALADNIPRLPTQLFEIGYTLVIFLILWFLRKRVKIEGILFWLFLLLYSAARFANEFFRESQRLFLGLSANQYISLAIFIVAAVFIYRMRKKTA